MNERDSEIAGQLLQQEGYCHTFSINDADVILINTCSIREKAEQKVFSMLGSLREVKLRKPSLLIGVTGCVAQQEGQQIFERMRHVDLVVGTQQLYQLPDMLGRLYRQETTREIATDLDSAFVIPAYQKLLRNNSPAPSQPAGIKRFVTIMQGCNNFCSYCVVPGTRGRETSRAVADIIEEVEILVAQGVKEITLLGQNVNSYGMTNKVASKNTHFPELLAEAARVQGLKRLRFTTSHPKDLSLELMRCFAEIDILCPHFHLPVQSGSNAILQRMNRKYTVETYMQQITTLRSLRPDVALATDIIVGFPGESEGDFQQTMDLVEKIRFHGMFSFKYSDRPHTRSAGFPDKVPEEVKAQRLSLLQARQDEIGLSRNREYVGAQVEMMVEDVSELTLKGRTPANHIVHCGKPPASSLVPGDMVPVLIEHAGKHSLTGNIQQTDKLFPLTH